MDCKVKDEAVDLPAYGVTSAQAAVVNNNHRYATHSLDSLDHMTNVNMAPMFSHYGYAPQQTHAHKTATSTFAQAYGMAASMGGGLSGSAMDLMHPAMASFQSSLGK